jgi:L-fucose isomerase-like protein
MTSRITIAYVPAHLPSYFAEEQGVFSSSLHILEQLAHELSFDLIVQDPIVTRAEAKRTAEALESSEVDFVLLQNSTFVMGDVVLEFAHRNFRLGLWATEEPTKAGPILLNNFVSMNLNASTLTRYIRPTVPFKWFYGSQQWLKERLAVTVQALRAIKKLSQSKVALVGGIAPTFYNFVFDERKLKTTLGLEVISHDLGEIFTRSQQIRDDKLQATIKELTEAAGGRVELSERDLKVSASVYLALCDFAREHGYDALAVSDWPAFQSELKIHPGMAFSWLDEHDHIPVASEGDVLGAATMLMMNEVNQGQSLLLDMNDIDEERDAVLMWHCGGSPLGFANDQGVRWKNHSTLGRKSDEPPMGAVADFIFRPQPITVTRLASDAEQLLILEANIIESPHEGYDGSRGWVSNFRLNHEGVNLADLVNTVMVEGLEHHFIVGSGHHANALSELANWLCLQAIKTTPYRPYLQLRTP